jgi:diacylglycerol kinase (ATP)
MKTIAIIANSKYKRAVQLKKHLRKLLSSDFQILDKLTEFHGHATELTLNAVNEEADIIIAAGGDGTMNEVVNGIMQATEDQRNKVLLALFPLGTGNDFARTANFTNSIKDLVKLIGSGKFRKIDLGYAEFQDENNEKKGRFFDNIAEIGVGARTVDIINKSNKILGSNLTFVICVLKAFIGYKRQSVHVITPDNQWVGKVVAVCVANGRYFGSGLGIAPEAMLDDGKLRLVIVGNISILHFLRYMPSLRKLKPIMHPEVHYFTVDSCKILSEGKHPFEMDGEGVGFMPFSAKLIPGAINLMGGE